MCVCVMLLVIVLWVDLLCGVIYGCGCGICGLVVMLLKYFSVFFFVCVMVMLLDSISIVLVVL